MEQRQKSQAERAEQQATSASGGRAEAPQAIVAFHRALFRTPEVAATNRDRGSSSDERPRRDDRKGKAPRADASPERINRQFSEAILREPLPKHYVPPTIGEYNGTTDPDDHLGKFDNTATLHQYTDGVKCRVFLTTLLGSAHRWFRRLPDGSITSFKDFRTAFLHHFACSRRYQKTSVSLFAIKQEARESLRAYIQRFNKVAMDIPTATSETMMNAFTQGLVDGDFFRSLIRKPPRDYDHMLHRANEYINVEEAQTARKKETPAERAPPAERKPHAAHQPPRGPRAETIRTHPRPHVQEVAAERPKTKKRWTPMFCSFHRTDTHNTRDCRSLPLIAHPVPRSGGRRSPSSNGRQRPRIAERIVPDRRQRHTPERQHTPRREDNPRMSRERPRPFVRDEENKSNMSRGEISIIAGGLTGGDSNRARKASVRQLQIHAVGCNQERASGPEISFGPGDLEGVEVPHDDALLIKAVIANYTIHRVFVDTGSSDNIIFKKAFDQLQID
ncbi:hypothetical protein ZIOFF_070325 [Zingiber officinale]|uniref:Retrotransposon gag domain-containing protein n=1 Tax=Zingiber officinale TaxID=94328 RepID=A0A8J5CEG2_ZINOF|nr:hypothetical protein ZIOFF_070325 [Zingiber officinale]